MAATWALVADRLQGRPKLGLVLLGFVAFVSAAAIVAGASVLTKAGDRLDAVHLEQGAPDLVISADSVASFRASLEGRPGVTATGAASRTVAAMVGPVGAEGVNSRIIAVDDPDTAGVGAPRLMSGRWAVGSDEIVVDQSWADESGFRIGSFVTVEVDGVISDLTAVGSAIDLGDCFFPNCDPVRHFVTGPGLQNVSPKGEGYIRGFASLDDGVDDEVFGSALAADFPQFGIGTWSDTRADLVMVAEISSYFVTGLGVFVLLASAIVVASTAVAAVVSRRREIGLLKAMGTTPRQIATSIVFEHLVVAVPGVVLGWLVGSLTAPSLEVGLVGALGRSPVRFQISLLILASLVVFVVLSLATLAPALRAARLSTLEALMESPSVTGERLQRVLDRLPDSPTFSLGTRLAVARPLRTGLAVIALALATAAIYATWSAVGAANKIYADSANSGDPWDVIISPAPPATPAQADAMLGADPAVEGWYRERELSIVVDQQRVTARATLPGTAEPGYVILEGRAATEGGEAVVGWGFLDSLGYQVGDRVSFSAAGTEMSLLIVGRHADTEDTGRILVTPIQSFDAAGVELAAPSWMVRTVDGADLIAFDQRIADSLPADSRVFFLEPASDEADPIIFPLMVLAAIILIVALGNLTATMASTAGERMRQTGILRALGLSSRDLVTQAALAGSVVGAGAALVGVPLGYLSSTILLDAVMPLVGIGTGLVSPPVLGPSLILTIFSIGAGALAGAVAVVSPFRMPVARLLRAE